MDQGIAVEKEPLTVGFWHCETCGAGGATDGLLTATDAAVVHSAQHRAKHGRSAPVHLQTWYVPGRLSVTERVA
jgi:hypothetical protein